MTCQDCINNDTCLLGKVNCRNDIEECCDMFKNRSLFVELPCKTGDIVYSIFDNKLTRDIVTSIAIGNNNELIIYTPLFSFTISEINKYVFYTREKAEQALKETNNKK